MPIYKICRVCLRTDFELRNLDGPVLDLFQEFCGKTKGYTSNFCCSFCHHLLKKYCHFKNKCLQANNVFENWKSTKSQKKPALSDLYKSIPLSTYGILTEDLVVINTTKYTEDIDITIKVEKIEDNQRDEIKIDNNDQCTNDDDKIDDDLNDNDTDDDKCLINFVKLEDKKEGVKVKKKKSETRSLDILVKTNPKKQNLRKPLKDLIEYESVFDIQLFSTDAEIRREFAARKTSPRYMEAPHKCDICYTVYKCQKLAEFHMKWHLPSAGEFSCDVCAMRFKSRSVIRKHKADVHYGRFACKKCPLITYHKQSMKLHFQKHQGKIHTCEVCNHTFKHVSSYLTHKRLTHATSHVCVTCARTFVSEQGLHTHRLKIHQADSNESQAGSVRCTPCGLTFPSQQVYTVHVLNTEQHKDLASEIVACPICGLSLCSAADVRKHRRLHHPGPNRTWPSRNPRKQKREKSTASDVIECKLCGLTGSNNFWLYQHYRTAHPSARYKAASDRGFLCDQCGRGFYNKTVLKEHMYVHSGLKPFRCETCPASFRSKSALKLHEQRHGPPSRECPHCGKKYASASNLANHIRSHGARRYACVVCSKGFVQFSTMRKHVRDVHLQLRAPRSSHSHKGALD